MILTHVELDAPAVHNPKIAKRVGGELVAFLYFAISRL